MKSITCCLICLVLSAAMALAEDRHIEIITTPKGVADEVIKIEEHKQRTIDAERERVEAERAEKSREFSEIADTYLGKGELDTAIDYYEKAIAADATNKEAHTGKINALKVRDQEEIKIGEKYHQAMEFLRKGLRRQAIDALVAEIKAHPENQTARDKLMEIEGQN